jgi:hypothetical protein
MEWLYYLLEANLYLVVFYTFYRLFLQHETFSHLNRYYLLCTSLISFALPVLQLGFLKPLPTVVEYDYATAIDVDTVVFDRLVATPVQETVSFSHYLYPIYLLIACVFALKLMVSFSKIVRLWFKSNKQKTGEVTLVELQEKAAFSFFNLLFIHPHLAEKQTVLNHEMVHIKQKHSFDILFFEILQVICWFNPFIYFLKKDVKLLHEYIADELSSTTHMRKHEYAMFLIENSFGITPTALTNQIFNQSILKRRINMLNKQRTASSARLRLLLSVPIFIGMLCISTLAFTKDYGYIDLLPEKSEMMTAMIQNPPQVVPNEKPARINVRRDSVIEVRTIARKPRKDRFYPSQSIKDGKATIIEKRHIVVNGNAVDNKVFTGVENANHIIFLNPADGSKKYGSKAKYGAVEIYGDNLKNTVLVDKLSANNIALVNGTVYAPVVEVATVTGTNGSRTVYTQGQNVARSDSSRGLVFATVTGTRVAARDVKVRGNAIRLDSVTVARTTGYRKAYKISDSVREVRIINLRIHTELDRSLGNKLILSLPEKTEVDYCFR